MQAHGSSGIKGFVGQGSLFVGKVCIDGYLGILVSEYMSCPAWEFINNMSHAGMGPSGHQIRLARQHTSGACPHNITACRVIRTDPRHLYSCRHISTKPCKF